MNLDVATKSWVARGKSSLNRWIAGAWPFRSFPEKIVLSCGGWQRWPAKTWDGSTDDCIIDNHALTNEPTNPNYFKSQRSRKMGQWVCRATCYCQLVSCSGSLIREFAREKSHHQMHQMEVDVWNPIVLLVKWNMPILVGEFSSSARNQSSGWHRGLWPTIWITMSSELAKQTSWCRPGGC